MYRYSQVRKPGSMGRTSRFCRYFRFSTSETQGFNQMRLFLDRYRSSASFLLPAGDRQFRMAWESGWPARKRVDYTKAALWAQGDLAEIGQSEVFGDGWDTRSSN